MPAIGGTLFIPCGKSHVSSVLLRHLVKSARSSDTKGKMQCRLSQNSRFKLPCFLLRTIRPGCTDGGQRSRLITSRVPGILAGTDVIVAGDTG